ncbi:hypothetical protein HA052_24660 [Chromobacterium haemolyticum]|uniref:DUF4102 domain-containing protein n=1 Tax=Chromobacterium fluminis TaxID=3044269 RepID=A0ABX0LHJ2_9NEIS|nr:MULTISPECIES: hypothetical protein [Chromobacterium]MCP1290911.1 hypothetical protein [Chromobacterium sp. S0633]NHR08388.1 hypothetical protein [Chromobacterium haemolyticum]
MATRHYPQPDYLERRAIQRSKELGGPLPPALTQADKRRAAARRAIEDRRIEREALQ